MTTMTTTRATWLLKALLACAAATSFAACGDEGGLEADLGSKDSALSDSGDAVDSSQDVLDDADTAEADILYPGYTCDDDEACSTRLCYGAATSQGHFEQPRCQTRCLEAFDYLHYCDSDDDCCGGHCCLDCGPQEGLCMIN